MHLTLTFCLLALTVADDTPTLESRLKPLIEAHKGKVAVGVKNLATGETFFHKADVAMPTASLIKTAILVEAMLQADEGKLSLKDRVTLRESDKVPGSGLLTTHFSDGTTLSLRDCLRLMIAVSDNTATNLVLDRVGIKSVNQRMESWGLKETKINAKVFRGSVSSVDPARTKKYGLGSTTAREMVTLFEKIQNNDGVRPALKLVMLEFLRRNEDRDKFGRLRELGITVAHKDGSVTSSKTDAGILYLPSGPVIVCVLTDGNSDRRWVRDNAGNLLCARVARAVYDHYKKTTLQDKKVGTR